jgi:hypothetical protein
MPVRDVVVSMAWSFVALSWLPGCDGGLGVDALGEGARVTANVIAGAATVPGQSALTLPASIATTTATSLHNLQYAIRDIQLCEDVTRSGSGFSDRRNCVAIYVNPNVPADTEFYDGYLVDQALVDTTEGRFIDLMTEAGRAELRNPTRASPVAAGTYRFGMINFLRPIRVNAEFLAVGDPNSRVYTRATTSTTELPASGTFRNQQALVGDVSAGPSELMTYMLNNGGSYFAFAEPFVVTPEEAAAGAPILIDLVFNPDSFGVAKGQDECRNAQVCDPLNAVVFDMPFVRMNPVPRKAGEQTFKETYLVDYDLDGGAKVRVELYFNAADADKAVRGVDVAVVYPSTATRPANNIVAADNFAQTGSIAAGDATVSLRDYQLLDTLSGLVRRTSGTATLHCTLTGEVCPTAGGTLSRAYTYEGDTLVSAN